MTPYSTLAARKCVALAFRSARCPFKIRFCSILVLSYNTRTVCKNERWVYANK